MHRTWCTKLSVTRGAQVLSHQNLHTYSTLQYSTVHYTTVHYITLHQSAVHYITLQYITSKYSTLQYITLHTCKGLGAQNRMSPEGHMS